jgi:hypothetical protein
MKELPARPFGEDVLNKIWSLQDKHGFLNSAFSILPPGMEGSLTKSETMSAFKKSVLKSSNPIIIGFPASYFTEEYLHKFKSAAEEAGLEISYRYLDNSKFFSALENPTASGIDYLMVGYVASDKFPFAQLKLLTSARNVDIPIPADDAPTEEKLKRLKDIQISFLEDQLIVPLFYVPSVTVYRSDLDLGNQPTTDAELQFWRINENFKASLP